ncbi:MAG: thiolase domain-containing protein, partial [Mesorhizobium sp.]
MTACIVGWAHSRFGKLEGETLEGLIAKVASEAADDRLRFKPATRVENACATGSAAVRQGIRAIDANAARIVLVVGAEQMTTTSGAEIGKNLLKASYLPEEGDTPAGFAGVFGKIAQAYF